MILYLETKIITLEDGDHEIVLRANDKESPGYDRTVDVIVLAIDEYNKYIVREQVSWWSFPLYEVKDDQMIPFDYTQYAYFNNTERRNKLAERISEYFPISAELKILRKTLRYIMDYGLIPYPEFFEKYDARVEELIEKNPK